MVRWKASAILPLIDIDNRKPIFFYSKNLRKKGKHLSLEEYNNWHLDTQGVAQTTPHFT